MYGICIVYEPFVLSTLRAQGPFFCGFSGWGCCSSSQWRASFTNNNGDILGIWSGNIAKIWWCMYMFNIYIFIVYMYMYIAKLIQLKSWLSTFYFFLGCYITHILGIYPPVSSNMAGKSSNKMVGFPASHVWLPKGIHTGIQLGPRFENLLEICGEYSKWLGTTRFES